MTEEDDLELFCGCRTEVGVHAYAQIANFKTSSSTTTQNIKHYLNRYLPMDIAIIDVKEVPEDVYKRQAMDWLNVFPCGDR